MVIFQCQLDDQTSQPSAKTTFSEFTRADEEGTLGMLDLHFADFEQYVLLGTTTAEQAWSAFKALATAGIDRFIPFRL